MDFIFQMKLDYLFFCFTIQFFLNIRKLIPKFYESKSNIKLYIRIINIKNLLLHEILTIIISKIKLK